MWNALAVNTNSSHCIDGNLEPSTSAAATIGLHDLCLYNLTAQDSGTYRCIHEDDDCHLTYDESGRDSDQVLLSVGGRWYFIVS